MNYEDLEEDTLLRTLLQEVDSTPKLPEGFTAKMMAAIEAESTEQALLYKPLISRQAWRVIVLGIGLLLLTTGLLGLLPLISSLRFEELPFAVWLSRNGLLLPGGNSSQGLATGYHLLGSGAICLAYLLLDKWQSIYWRQTFASKQRN